MRLQLWFGIGFLTLFTGLASAQTGTISGMVKYSGAPPKMELIKFNSDPVCAKLTTGPVYREDIILNKNRTLRNVIVALKQGPAGRVAPPTAPATLDQKGCIYIPHVIAVMTGQELRILNSDPTFHNVHGEPKANPRFNLPMISDKAQTITRKFDKPEAVPFPIVCDVHPWMLTWVGVYDHPFFAVTGDDGSFAIRNVPAGDYTVVAWQEKLGMQQQQVKLGGGETKSMEFIFSPK